MQIASEKKTDDILGDPSQALTLYSPLENTMSTSHMLKKKKSSQSFVNLGLKHKSIFLNISLLCQLSPWVGRANMHESFRGSLVRRRGRSWCLREVGRKWGNLSIFLFWLEDLGLTNHRKRDGPFTQETMWDMHQHYCLGILGYKLHSLRFSFYILEGWIDCICPSICLPIFQV